MELYKWHKGTELPTEECDCVVVYLAITPEYDYETATLGHVYLEHGKFITADHRDEEISQENIIAWMPIKFPEEVE